MAKTSKDYIKNDKMEYLSIDKETETLVVSEKRKICVCCNRIRPLNHYFTMKTEFIDNDNFGICKDCVGNSANKDDIESILKLFRFMDKPMFEKRWQDNMSKSEGKDFIIALGKYFASIAMLGDRRFADSDLITTDTRLLQGGLINDAPILVRNEDNQVVNNIDDLNEEQIKAKNDVIKILDYDPFDGYNLLDQKFLYPELVRYLDEDTVEDTFKVSVIIQIITNSLQIRWCDIAINKLGSSTDSFIKNSTTIKELGATKATLNQNNDKLSKENQIASKHRGDSSSKNSTLGSMMKSLREMDFEKAEMDYYTMQKSYGMKQSMDISNQSIVDIIKFDENKQNEVFKTQRDMIVKYQEEELEFNEKIRLLIKENNELKRQIEK